MLQCEEDGVTEPNPGENTESYQAVPGGRFIEVEHQTGVEKLKYKTGGDLLR